MEMQMEFIRKLPAPQDLQVQFPVTDYIRNIKSKRDEQIQRILSGKDSRFLLIIGPCSADNETAVLDYMNRLAAVQEQVADKIFIIPRVYTNKPRTIGVGYKGMLHQPDPEGKEDMLAGIIAIREMNARIVKDTGFTCAEEILYPEIYRYLSDLLSYAAVGARSVEDQLHRMVASGTGIPVGMKNPTSGDISVMLNSIEAAQHSQEFLFRGWEVRTEGNPQAHAILRGYVDSFGNSLPNYHYENLQVLLEAYHERKLKNPAVIVDTNHANSGKKYMEQIRIAKDVMHSRHMSADIRGLVKGLMIESYIEDGSQKITEGVYGKSITDPCLGWEKSRQLILELADLL
ncbi:phospho-2-dehydro-3-deoxyheptonate aldolase [Megasphaera cerevisiae DSM 20462]|jgi:3-deoxy-7-phosphoheptulonate synthase|uniref:Phospho-2-dehydro-3-deoxyheptonate aldolase n=1 Tax=Megasphaera cerevisiae DSM 20462 TaxID=1122219 RepID=A0A0J6WT25_9FIRM|nr:3-deoxy-7-phosphoheptulonate synthase [Megasphaera cerevisiae]KMO85649.1 phospho-2-dehydro-3-deoxyheptonate aldolase [Megasphaera cerevisiae DSM 20462]OKY52527.1 3-deoxy-7-phosphoheptulonate synthase [Megasphaera cerevisiae]SKA14188.1 3-deoxy-D-arabinoheptulosonate-7-phosphate synthase [Megasphaera cerevisiae DSM 20462]